MRIASVLSTVSSPEAAIDDVTSRLAAAMADARADLAFGFASPHHAETLGRLGEALQLAGRCRHFLGCTGEAIVGEAREVEGQPALSLWAAQLPYGGVQALRLPGRPDLAVLEGFRADTSTSGTLLLLGDPFSFDADGWIRMMAKVAPSWVVIGGMASAGHQPGVNRLALDGEVNQEGAVAVLLSDNIRVRSIVSQGCRPIGQTMVVTRAERNIVRELGGRPALERFQEMFVNLEPADQVLVRSGLHIGRVINEYRDQFGRGDFLVRNVVGADEEGGIAVSDLVRVGQTVQFHVRDAATADEDLRTLLGELPEPGRVAGALLFTCNGRGTRLFNAPDHDVTTMQEVIGRIPVAGFFAMGELGPIGGQTFMHGFTASIALFEEPGSSAS